MSEKPKHNPEAKLVALYEEHERAQEAIEKLEEALFQDVISPDKSLEFATQLVQKELDRLNALAEINKFKGQDIPELTSMGAILLEIQHQAQLGKITPLAQFCNSRATNTMVRSTWHSGEIARRYRMLSVYYDLTALSIKTGRTINVNKFS